jgi:APA family basic amino acid/polyamine antiporter
MLRRMTKVDGAPGTLRRTLGLWQVSLAGIGVILGAGVYALIAPAAAEAGGALWLAFVLAGAAAAFTAYAYARLGRIEPKTSPEFRYTALAFGPRVGFVAGWLMLVADLSAAGAVALGFAGYLHHLTGIPVPLSGLALLLALAVLLEAGIAQSVNLAITLTVVEAAGLLFVIAIGVPAWGNHGLLDMPRGVAGVSSAAALIFFAYLGFDELGNFAEEMRHPARDLPRALFVSVAATTLVYIAVALSATALVDWRTLGASDAPLALVARRVLGPRADAALTLVALGATANTVLLLLVSASRSLYGMGTAGVLPAQLGRVTRRGSPARATWLAVGGIAVLVGLGTLTQAAFMTDALVLTSFLGVDASLFWLAARRRLGGGAGRRVTDLVFAGLALALCGWLLAHIEWAGLLAAVALGVLGAAITVFRSPAAGSVS